MQQDRYWQSLRLALLPAIEAAFPRVSECLRASLLGEKFAAGQRWPALTLGLPTA